MDEHAAHDEFELASFFPYLVHGYYLAVSQAVKSVYGEHHGLSVGEWRTMVVLINVEPLSAKQIVERSNMDKVSVSRAISGLQQRRFLERHVDPTDRRRVLLRLTSRGRHVVRELIPRVQDVENQLLSGLSKAERQHLEALMGVVRQNAESIRTGPDSPDVDAYD